MPERITSFDKGHLQFSKNEENYILDIQDGTLTERYSEKDLKVLNEPGPVAKVPYRQRWYLNGQFSPLETFSLLNDRTEVILSFLKNGIEEKISLIVFGLLPQGLLVTKVDD